MCKQCGAPFGHFVATGCLWHFPLSSQQNACPGYVVCCHSVCAMAGCVDDVIGLLISYIIFENLTISSVEHTLPKSGDQGHLALIAVSIAATFGRN